MTDDNRSQALKDIVAESMDRWTVPGVTVGIWNDGTQELYAFGTANLETGYEMAEDTILQIGSISKIFTTTLLMTLVDEGLIDLDDPVSKHLPGFRLTTQGTEDKVRIRDLVSHVSGIYGDHFDDFGWGDDALAQYVASMSDLRQVYEPGTIWSYTNSAFNLSRLHHRTEVGHDFRAGGARPHIRTSWHGSQFLLPTRSDLLSRLCRS